MTRGKHIQVRLCCGPSSESLSPASCLSSSFGPEQQRWNEHFVRAREMAQELRCVLCGMRAAVWVLSTCVKSKHGSLCLRPQNWEAEAGGVSDSPASQDVWKGGLQAQWEIESNRERDHGLLWILHKSVGAHIHTLMGIELSLSLLFSHTEIRKTDFKEEASHPVHCLSAQRTHPLETITTSCSAWYKICIG